MHFVIESSDLDRFSRRQLQSAARLLAVYARQGAPWMGEGVRLCTNGRRAAPYLVDDADNVAMLDRRGRLRQLFRCQGCGLEGFDGDIHRFDGRPLRLRFEANHGYCTARCRRQSEPLVG